MNADSCLLFLLVFLLYSPPSFLSFSQLFKCSLQVNYFVCLASTPHNVEHWEAIYQNIGFAQMATQKQTRTQEAGKKTLYQECWITQRGAICTLDNYMVLQPKQAGNTNNQVHIGLINISYLVSM